MTQYDNCPNCFAPLYQSRFCQSCGCDTPNIRKYPGSLPAFTILRGRYMLGRVLGRGGFGITYVALDLTQNRLCAVKEYMPSEYAARKSDSMMIHPNEGSRANYIYRHGMEKFREEAMSLQRLQNNYIVVNILDFFNDNNTAYLVMEYLKEDLHTIAKKNGGVLDPDYAKLMLIQVASGLMEIHRMGVLHRDISPENIMVDANGRFVLIDFGAARSYVSQQNKGMSVLLKPGFSPPEQYSSQGDQGTWSDVYALCATFYKLVSGKKPMDISALQRGVKLPTLWELKCGVSKQTSDAIEYGMQLEVKNRCPDFKTLLDRIDLPTNSQQRFPAQLPPQPAQSQQDSGLLRRQEEQRRQQEELQRQQEEQRRQEDLRRQQEELQRQQEEQRRQQEEFQRQQEEYRRQQEEQRRQEELRRQQEEQRRQQEEFQRQQEEYRRQQEEQRRQEEEQRRQDAQRQKEQWQQELIRQQQEQQRRQEEQRRREEEQRRQEEQRQQELQRQQEFQLQQQEEQERLRRLWEEQEAKRRREEQNRARQQWQQQEEQRRRNFRPAMQPQPPQPVQELPQESESQELPLRSGFRNDLRQPQGRSNSGFRPDLRQPQPVNPPAFQQPQPMNSPGFRPAPQQPQPVPNPPFRPMPQQPAPNPGFRPMPQQPQPSASAVGVVTLINVPGAPSATLRSGETVSIGRSRERCRLVDSTASYISKEHCRVRFDAAARCFYVTDLSVNGTFHSDGRPFPKEQAIALQPNETFYLAMPTHRISLQIKG